MSSKDKWTNSNNLQSGSPIFCAQIMMFIPIPKKDQPCGSVIIVSWPKKGK